MALPLINHPLFTVVLPSTGKEIKIRPFTVKEEKLLLIANSSKEIGEVLDSIKQILNACIVADKSFNIDNCAIFDIEYLFVQLRSKSVNNIIDLSITDKDDDKVYDIKVNLDDVKVIFDKDYSRKIMLSDVAGLVLNYPSYKTLNLLRGLQNNLEQNADDMVLKIYAGCIESIFDDTSVHTSQDFTVEEAVDFLSSLPLAAFTNIKDFFNNMPSLSYEVKYTNSLGIEKSIKLRGLSDFFI